MKLVIITILTLSLISKSTMQPGAAFYCQKCNANYQIYDKTSCTSFSHPPCPGPPTHTCTTKIDSTGNKDLVKERDCTEITSLGSEYVLNECQRIGVITYCSCSTSSCNSKQDKGLPPPPRATRLQCHYCYDCGNTNGLLMDCPPPSKDAIKDKTYYCTTEGYGSLVRRSCGVDLPVDKYKLDDKCHKELDNRADMESTYCACKTDGCNNQTVATSYALPKIEKTAMWLLITTLVVLSFV